MGGSVRAFLLLLAFASVEALRRNSEHAKSQLLFHRRRRTASQYAGLNWAQHYQKYTGDLSVTQNPKGMVAKCKPVFEEPRGTSRGLIVLQHGYTACAGFWYKLVPMLVQAGWTVVAPNLPGHGRKPTVRANSSNSYQVLDYLNDLPEKGSDFEAYSMELAQIGSKYKAANAGKELVLVGCSHGAAVALYMAMNGESGTWDRIMLMNPFLAPPTSLGADYGVSYLRKLLPQALPLLSVFRGDGDKITWGPECEEARWPSDPRKSGHGGMCQFSLKNFRAVLEFGNIVEGEARARAAKEGVFTGGVIDRAKGVGQLLTHKAWSLVSGGGKPPPGNLKIQVLATAFDGAVSNARIHFLTAAIKTAFGSQRSGFCAVDKDFEHTFINPIDKALDLDMWWLESNRVQGGKSVLDMLVDFSSKGILVPTDGTVQDDKALKGDSRCAVNKRR